MFGKYLFSGHLLTSHIQLGPAVDDVLSHPSQGCPRGIAGRWSLHVFEGLPGAGSPQAACGQGLGTKGWSFPACSQQSASAQPAPR